MAGGPTAWGSAPEGALGAYFALRWRGEVSLGRGVRGCSSPSPPSPSAARWGDGGVAHGVLRFTVRTLRIARSSLLDQV